MRTIKPELITEKVRQLCFDAAYDLSPDVENALKTAMAKEISPTGKEILRQILENAEIARKEDVPICQDTGFAVFFVEIGDQVFVEGNITDAINEGVKLGYTEGYLRKSVLKDPIRGGNSGDNTPAICHYEFVPGDKIKITHLPKGGGSENMSGIKMGKPADGAQGVIDFVVNRVSEAGPNPCPPIVVGVGIGGTFEQCAKMAKKALLRPLDVKNPDPFYAEMEETMLEKINNLGVGPQGLGGITTCIGVNILAHPRHIASFPVAINIECHAHRHKEIEI
ncbi:MAG: fumarate hydratase [Acidobacteria bacterium]|nr:fumarate hydratase [Acidobacteriota bacterium]